MPNQKLSKIIVDTNIWISFLIGKDFQILKSLIVNEKVKLITTDQLIVELKVVTSREQIKKYFDEEKVIELISLFDIIAQKVRIRKIVPVCRDPKDDFLFALAKESKADFIITGDKDLLVIKKIWENRNSDSKKIYG